MKAPTHSGTSSRTIDLIPKEEWGAYRLHQQRLKWAKLGEVMGERMNQCRLDNNRALQSNRCS